MLINPTVGEAVRIFVKLTGVVLICSVEMLVLKVTGNASALARIYYIHCGKNRIVGGVAFRT